MQRQRTERGDRITSTLTERGDGGEILSIRFALLSRGAHRTDTVDQIAGMMFGAFFALGWTVPVIVLLVLAVVLGFYRVELRSGSGKLTLVTYVGPVGVVAEYDLSRIRNVRNGGAAQ